MTSLDEMRRELRRRYERLCKEEERRKTMLKYYEPIKTQAWPPLYEKIQEHQVGDSEGVKRYTLWIERLEKAGMRDPKDPFKIIPLSSPRVKREIQRLKIELAYAKGEIDLDEYHKRHEKWEKEAIKFEGGLDNPPRIDTPDMRRELREKIGILDKNKAEYWIELLKMAVFDPTLDRTEKTQAALNILYMSGEHLELEEFTKFVRRWRLLTAPLEEPILGSESLA